jgi:hypothetical protein
MTNTTVSSGSLLSERATFGNFERIYPTPVDDQRLFNTPGAG